MVCRGAPFPLKNTPPCWCYRMVKSLKNNVLHLVDRYIFRIFVIQKGREELPDFCKERVQKSPCTRFPTNNRGTKIKHYKGMETNATNQKLYSTTYAVATSYIGGSLILCNSIESVDEELLYGETIGLEYDEETEEYPEIYQYYLTSWSDSDTKWLHDHFGLMFAYSGILGLWVLLVDHYGTGWDYVEVETDIHQAQAPLGTIKIN